MKNLFQNKITFLIMMICSISFSQMTSYSFTVENNGVDVNVGAPLGDIANCRIARYRIDETADDFISLIPA